ncbi:MAG: hypothetical protein R8G66_22230 [Cytophagales bacterium]|nr:hypothetical protein [Cytophagales bacterium]
MELKGFSWRASELKSGAKDVTYCFKYKIGVANPYYIFYALANNKAVDTSSIGNPINTAQVEVLLNGESVEVDTVGTNSFNYKNGLCLRLKDFRVPVGSMIEVILKGVKNKSIPGKYSWKWITTATCMGDPIEEVTNGRKVIHLVD